VIRGERLIKLGKSWFSVKFIEVKRNMAKFRGRALNRYWVVTNFTEPNETPNTKYHSHLSLHKIFFRI